MYREPEGDTIPRSGGGPVGLGEGSNPPTCPGIPIRFSFDLPTLSHIKFLYMDGYRTTCLLVIPLSGTAINALYVLAENLCSSPLIFCIMFMFQMRE